MSEETIDDVQPGTISGRSVDSSESYISVAPKAGESVQMFAVPGFQDDLAEG
jgi:hypothetical protein